VGIIGLGNMGRRIARNVLRGGYAVPVYDLSPAAVQNLVDDGPVAAVVQQLHAAVRAKGRGGWDSLAIVTVFEELDDVEVRATEP
jgi:3-hydroxyisobutyrate dehydrogenase-like beta-hydroxyacid dehydrogenase